MFRYLLSGGREVFIEASDAARADALFQEKFGYWPYPGMRAES